MLILLAVSLVFAAAGAPAADTAETIALRNARQASEALLRSNRVMHAWLKRTDPVTGPLGIGIEDTWSLCFGLGASFLWSPVRDMAVRLGMYRTQPFLSSADLSNGAPGAVSFRLGLEFALP